MRISLKVKFLVAIISGILALSIFLVFFITNTFKEETHKSTSQTLQMLSKSISQTLTTTMMMGDSKIVRQSLENSKKIDGIYKLDVIKSKKVIDIFKLNEIYNPSPDIQKVFNTKKEYIEEIYKDNNHLLIIRKPFIAENRCLICHTNANIGDVLGVMDMRVSLENMDKAISFLNNSIILIMLIVMVIAITVAFILIQQLVITPLNKFQNGLLEFFKFINKEQDETKTIDVEIKYKDEISDIADTINQNIKKIIIGLEKDLELIKDVASISDKVNAGFYIYKVTKTANDPMLEKLKLNFNNMLQSTEDNLFTIMSAINSYGKSDFTHRIEKVGVGNIGSMVSAVQTLGINFSEIMAMIISAGNNLKEKTSILSETSSTLFNSAKNQASHLESIVKNIESVSKNVKSSYTEMESMLFLANETKRTTEDGNSYAKNVYSAMEEISNSTDLISQSIESIEQIAFQTNILSLNAAVEAATAGEAGKGFAVVAGEVRNLANRSAEVAKEINLIVNKAEENVSKGKYIIEKVVEGFGNVLIKTDETAFAVNIVAEESKKQMIEINNIHKSIDETNNMVQDDMNTIININEVSKKSLQIAEDFIIATNRTKSLSRPKDQVCDIDLMFDIAELKLQHITEKESIYDRQENANIKFKISKEKSKVKIWLENNKYRKVIKTSIWDELIVLNDKFDEALKEFIFINEKGNITNERLQEIAVKIENYHEQIFDKMDRIKTQRCKELNKS